MNFIKEEQKEQRKVQRAIQTLKGVQSSDQQAPLQ
jgi:hypothetical protein